MCTSADKRIIFGGLDDSTSDPEKRNHKILYKKDKLIEEFNELFPSIKVEAEYYLGAYYGVTRDGLPMIGEYEESPHCYFMYGYGDNGTVYNMVLGKIVADILTAGTSGDLELYLQTRPLRMNV
jgi:glycine/D-amino acid oxidase-like deaminating enzyme